MFLYDKKFVSKMQDIFINEMMVIPSRIRDGSFKMEDMVPGYRFEYLMDPNDLPDVGLSEKEVVWQEGHVKLYRYKSLVEKPASPPVFVVYALINRPYILDLRPGMSFIEYLLKNGQDVYMVDWGDPVEEDRYLDLGFYITHYMDMCVEKIRQISKVDKINLFGWCIGGTFTLIYAALFNEKINSLMTLTTPGSHDTGGLLSYWSDSKYFDTEKIINAFGNIPGKFIRYGVIDIYPDRELLKNSTFYENMNNPQFLGLYMLVEKWMNDNVDFPGKVFQEFIYSVFQNSNLLKGKVEIDGKKVDLKNIKCPYLNIACQQDHLVPVDSSKDVNDYIGAKENLFEVIPGGHVGFAFEPAAQQVGWVKALEWLKKNSSVTTKKTVTKRAGTTTTKKTSMQKSSKKQSKTEE